MLPSLILIGVGFGLTLGPSFATATFGVAEDDSGVASAMVNTSQQIGGAIGTALLSTVGRVGSQRVPDRARPGHRPSGG